MFHRVVRGMIPHKTPRGAAALARLRLYEGMPPPFDRQKRMVVPQALRVIRLAPGRKFTVLKRLATEMGWKYQGVVEKLEEKRKVKSAAYYAKKKAILKVTGLAKAKVEKVLAPIDQKLALLGY